MELTPLAVERRQIDNSAYSMFVVQTRSGQRTFRVADQRSLVSPCELETRDDAENEIIFRGHATVFGRKSEDLGGFREIINPGAFRRVLDSSPDVRALFNHDPSYVLGRTKNGTLDLREDPKGLHSYFTAPDVSYARDLRTLVKRGDVDQMSFAFSMGTGSRDRWEETEDGEILRTVIEVSGLHDVSIVTYPAYPQTNVGARDELAADTSQPAEVDADEEELRKLASDEAAEAKANEARQARKQELLAGARRRLALARK